MRAFAKQSIEQLAEGQLPRQVRAERRGMTVEQTVTAYLEHLKDPKRKRPLRSLAHDRVPTCGAAFSARYARHGPRRLESGRPPRLARSARSTQIRNADAAELLKPLGRLPPAIPLAVGRGCSPG